MSPIRIRESIIVIKAITYLAGSTLVTFPREDVGSRLTTQPLGLVEGCKFTRLTHGLEKKDLEKTYHKRVHL